MADDIQGELPERLGFRITAAGPEAASGELAIDPALLQIGKVLHGGVLFAFADSIAAEIAVRAAAPAGTATADAQIRFLAPARHGVLAGEGRIAHRAGRSLMIEVRVIDEAGELIALYGSRFAVTGSRP
jgi:acyl-CoA thioesterase